MFRVLLQSLILASQFSSAVIVDTKQQETFHKMNSTQLYMEISRATQHERRFEKEENLQELSTKTNEITKTDSGNRKTNIGEPLDSKKGVTLNLCLVFIYHLASKPRHIGTSLLAATTFFFYQVSSFPLNKTPINLSANKTSNVTKENHQQTTKGKRTQRSTSSGSKTFVQGSCDSAWYEKDGKCYRIIKEGMDYNSAKDHCSTYNSEIVKIGGQEKNSFIHQLINELHMPGYLWIRVNNGCTDCVGNYQNWYPGHPGKHSECTAMVRNGKWKNFNCGYTFSFVCEKDVPKPKYSEETLLIALLVPVFSCISVAVTLTTFLLVSSVRRGDQPFKMSSRYALKKTKRRIATWDMIDTLRRASLKRRSSRSKSSKRDSTPTIEVTSPSGEKCGNGVENKDVAGIMRRWSRRSMKRLSQPPPPPESPNSSLYELLSRMNNMSFVQSRFQAAMQGHEEATTEESEEELDTRLNNLEGHSAKTDVESIEFVEIKNSGEHFEKNGKNSSSFREDQLQLQDIQEDPCCAKNAETLQDSGDEERSFRNLAFRDSTANMSSIEGNSSGEAGNLAMISEKSDIEKDDYDHGNDECRQSTQCDSKATQRKESMDAPCSKNTTTIKVDVHKPTKDSSKTEGNVNPETNNAEKKSFERTKVVWTCSV